MSFKNFFDKKCKSKMILQAGKKGTCKNLQVDKTMKFEPCVVYDNQKQAT